MVTVAGIYNNIIDFIGIRRDTTLNKGGYDTNKNVSLLLNRFITQRTALTFYFKKKSKILSYSSIVSECVIT